MKINKLSGWRATSYNKVLTKYSGKSFFEMWDDEAAEFLRLPDEEKLEMAYWVEHQAGKKGWLFGLLFGIIIGVICSLIVIYKFFVILLIPIVIFIFYNLYTETKKRFGEGLAELMMILIFVVYLILEYFKIFS